MNAVFWAHKVHCKEKSVAIKIDRNAFKTGQVLNGLLLFH